jgi:hypothetical protein
MTAGHATISTSPHAEKRCRSLPMPFCFLNQKPNPDGEDSVPIVPDGVRAVLLADLPGLEWGLFEVHAAIRWKLEAPVDEQLDGLIRSALRFPPALALARNELGLVFEDRKPTRDQLIAAYTAALESHLAKQNESPYVLAPAIKDDPGYLKRGEWYWVIEVSGRPAVVRWISSDFRIYKGDVTDFDLTGQQLKNLGYIA